MLISFIIPHYNLSRELLQRCITSILAQNTLSEEYEILIIDDGSVEPPMWVAEEYSNANIKLIIAEHKGLGAARNIGIENAKGEYIQFIDSDDCLTSNSLKSYIEILKKEHPDILQHRYRVCLNEKEAKKTYTRPQKTETYNTAADYVARNNLTGSACNYIFKKEIADRHNLRFATDVLHEDEDFTLQLYYWGGRLICSNIPLYNYCIRSGSITANNDNSHECKRIKDLFRLLTRITTFRFNEQEKSSTTQRKALNRKLAMLTVDTLLNLFYNGDSAKEIENICNNELYPLGLYPLPMKNHSFKYIIFATMANSSTGLKILRKILPLQKPQKR